MLGFRRTPSRTQIEAVFLFKCQPTKCRHTPWVRVYSKCALRYGHILIRDPLVCDQCDFLIKIYIEKKEAALQSYSPCEAQSHPFPLSEKPLVNSSQACLYTLAIQVGLPNAILFPHVLASYN